jgi:transposase
MIGFFTDPYPDELLYSACSRYHRRAGNRSKEATALDLFGKGQTSIIVDFQTQIDYLVNQLPPTTYTASRLIEQNTMLPLYVPFMTAERHVAIRHDMCGNGGGSIHARLGILTSGLDIEHLRFCPVCVEEDREPYWHRVHQVPGVEVCPEHVVFLSDSAVSVRNRSNAQAFVTLKQAVDELPLASRAIHPLDLGNREHQALLRLAKDAAWLLKTLVEVHDRNLLRRRYLRLLLEHGVATYSGKVDHTRLKVRFLDHYSPELLERLRCGLELRYHWLRRLVNDWKRARHPLHHLLLMQFLGCPAEKFFRLPIEVEPFGKGPWPCLNITGGHYREDHILECQIGNMTDKSGRISGTFRCECGFSYRRIGPDTSNERRYQYDLLMSFGETWYEKLRELRAGNRSREEMAQALGVSVLTVRGEVRRLERSRESGMPLAQRYQRSRNDPALIDPEILDRQRKQWLEVANENPNAGRSMLASKASYSYHWLFKYDRRWLGENSPERLGSPGTSPRIDWSERDKKYSADVRETAAEMLTAYGCPVWVSRTAVLKKLGILTVVTKNSAKLPLTDKTLKEVSENVTSFAIRRIRWAADCYCQEQVLPTEWRLQSRARVSHQMMRYPDVKATSEECVRILREMNESGWEGLAKGLG